MVAAAVSNIRPCSAVEAVRRALLLVGSPERYVLGCGNFRPHGIDLPWTTNEHGTGSDCWGYAGAWCYQLPRHRPGFNHGSWATVSDDINTDSSIEDGEHRRELFEVVDYPRLGDLLVYPAIRDAHGKRMRIGHVGIVVGLCAEWDHKAPQYGELEVVQCQSSRRPAVIKTMGMAWMWRDLFRGERDEKWRTRILRVVP